MLLDDVSVTTLPDYQLNLLFKNGERRRFDMRPLLTMKPWNQVASVDVFSHAQVDYGAVVWPGEIDVAPETLYDNSAPIN